MQWVANTNSTIDTCNSQIGCVHTDKICTRKSSSSQISPLSETSSWTPTAYTRFTLESSEQFGYCLRETGDCVFEDDSGNGALVAVGWVIAGLLIALVTLTTFGLIMSGVSMMYSSATSTTTEAIFQPLA